MSQTYSANKFDVKSCSLSLFISKNCFQICTDCKSKGNDFLKYNILMTAPVNATNTISFLSSWARIFTTSQAPLVNSTGSVFPWNHKNQLNCKLREVNENKPTNKSSPAEVKWSFTQRLGSGCSKVR